MVQPTSPPSHIRSSSGQIGGRDAGAGARGKAGIEGPSKAGSRDRCIVYVQVQQIALLDFHPWTNIWLLCKVLDLAQLSSQLQEPLPMVPWGLDPAAWLQRHCSICGADVLVGGTVRGRANAATSSGCTVQQYVCATYAAMSSKPCCMVKARDCGKRLLKWTVIVVNAVLAWAYVAAHLKRPLPQVLPVMPTLACSLLGMGSPLDACRRETASL